MEIRSSKTAKAGIVHCISVSDGLSAELAKAAVLETQPFPVLGLHEASHIYLHNFQKDAASGRLVDVRRSAGRAAKKMLNHKEIYFTGVEAWSEAQWRSALIGFTQACYSFDRYRPQKSVQTQKLYVPATVPRKAIKEAQILAEALDLCRDLINTPAQDMGPAQVETAARKVCLKYGIKLRLMDAKELHKQKMGCILGVGRASHLEPRMLILDYMPTKIKGVKNSKKEPFLALCGKGVCFDTGGLDIKPASGMELMRKDMGGAATVIATMAALAQLGAKHPVRAYIPLVENAIGPDAFRPGDVLTAADGTTIEIGHTDAEGRLILADAICQAVKDKVSGVITVATLTGAAQVATGRSHVPVMGCDSLVESLLGAGDASGEKIWRLPLDVEHRQAIRGKYAQLNNAGSRDAGVSVAGAFLEHFAQDLPFAHADISPSSWQPSDHDLGPSGATGMFVTTLVEALR